MFLSAHFNLCFICELVFIAYFLIVDYVSWNFIGLTVFYCMPDVVSFTLLGAECFCNPINPLELSSGTVKLLEIV